MVMAGIEKWQIPQPEMVLARENAGTLAGGFSFPKATLKRLPEFYEKVKALPVKSDSWESAPESYTTVGQL